MPRKAERQEIRWRDLRRMTVCNSEKLPAFVEIDGKRFTWVGIGWIECREAPKSTDPIVVD